MKKTTVIIIMIFFFLVTLRYAEAEERGIVSDNSMNSKVNEQAGTFNITGGTKNGGNLFHSFQDFNVNAGKTADFRDAAGLGNIICRVTGKNDSRIDGILKISEGSPDLYLLNSKGIMFGADAEVDISGSFHITTADYLKFEDNGVFYTDLSKQSVVSSDPVSTFGFADYDIGDIFFNGDTSSPKFKVGDTKRLSIIGGNVFSTQRQFFAYGGRIDIASVASPGEIKSIYDGIDISSDQLGNIELKDKTHIRGDNKNEAGDIINSAGEIFIRGGRFVLKESYLGVDNYSDVYPEETKIVVNVQNMDIKDNSIISANTNSSGDAGDIRLNATGKIRFDNVSAIFIETGSPDIMAGMGGTLLIEAKNIEFTGGSQITASTLGAGIGGDIRLEAYDTIRFAGSSDDGSKHSAIFVRTEFPDDIAGDGGYLVMEAANIEFADGAGITASTSGGGDAGFIEMHASKIYFNNESAILIETGSNSDGAGEGGYLFIEAQNIKFNNGRITASTYGAGTGGDIELYAFDTIRFTGDGGIFAKASQTSGGDSGSINVTADNVVLSNQCKITAETESFGDGGNICLTADRFYLNSEASVSSESKSTENNAGKAGEIKIIAHDFIKLDNGRFSTASENAAGGGITIAAKNLLYLLNSEITTSVKVGEGSGGNIYIDPVFVILNHSKIKANAWGGDGGGINIIADYYIPSPDSIIEASSKKSTPGAIKIQAVGIDVHGSLGDMNTDLSDVTKWSQTPCSVWTGENIGKLVIKTRDALPTPLDDFFSSGPIILIDGSLPKLNNNRNRNGGLSSSQFIYLNTESCSECE